MLDCEALSRRDVEISLRYPHCVPCIMSRGHTLTLAVASNFESLFAGLLFCGLSQIQRFLPAPGISARQRTALTILHGDPFSLTIARHSTTKPWLPFANAQQCAPAPRNPLATQSLTQSQHSCRPRTSPTASNPNQTAMSTTTKTPPGARARKTSAP